MSSDILTRVPPAATARVKYGPDNEQFGDLRVPAGPGPHPVVVLFHGGWWRSEENLGYLGHVAAALAADGIATWNLEFRRLGATGGGWPTTFLDVAAGADHLLSLAGEYPLDLSRVYSLGHSAGGHLALWLAARPRVRRDSAIYSRPLVNLRGAISIAGGVDLAFLSKLPMLDGFVQSRVVDELVGGRPDQVPERYAAASPCELLPLGVRQVLVQGTADDYTPSEIPTRYARVAERLGDKVSLVWISGADHFDPIDPLRPAFRSVRDAVFSLLNVSLTERANEAPKVGGAV